MKVYYFHPGNGIYQCEDYENSRRLSKSESRREGKTAVAPPAFEKGMIPVFDSRKATWSVVSIAEVSSLVAAAR